MQVSSSLLFRFVLFGDDAVGRSKGIFAHTRDLPKRAPFPINPSGGGTDAVDGTKAADAVAGAGASADTLDSSTCFASGNAKYAKTLRAASKNANTAVAFARTKNTCHKMGTIAQRQYSEASHVLDEPKKVAVRRCGLVAPARSRPYCASRWSAADETARRARQAGWPPRYR